MNLALRFAQDAYPTELPSLFREAKDRFGLGITIHAGETGRAENVRSAVELFGADRIGHGTAAGKDPELLELLSSLGICVEVCPISNRLTGCYLVGKPRGWPSLQLNATAKLGRVPRELVRCNDLFVQFLAATTRRCGAFRGFRGGATRPACTATEEAEK